MRTLKARSYKLRQSERKFLSLPLPLPSQLGIEPNLWRRCHWWRHCCHCRCHRSPCEHFHRVPCNPFLLFSFLCLCRSQYERTFHDSKTHFFVIAVTVFLLMLYHDEEKFINLFATWKWAMFTDNVYAKMCAEWKQNLWFDSFGIHDNIWNWSLELLIEVVFTYNPSWFWCVQMETSQFSNVKA